MKNLIFLDTKNETEVYMDQSAGWLDTLAPAKSTRTMKREATRAARRAAGKDRAKSKRLEAKR